MLTGDLSLLRILQTEEFYILIHDNKVKNIDFHFNSECYYASGELATILVVVGTLLNQGF